MKHDCAQVMELSGQGGSLVNGNGDSVHIEEELVYPLVKSSMLKHPVIAETIKYVIVTQKHIGEDTNRLADMYPKAWAYLQRHSECFVRRKSIIYRNAPPFSIFGVGDYSFATYKVGLSGFYKKPLFALLDPIHGKPTFLDDTLYFLSFSNRAHAYLAMLLLNEASVQEFLKGICFIDSKRPFTKKVLERIDFRKITEKVSIEALASTERRLGLPPLCTSEMYQDFQALLPKELF